MKYQLINDLITPFNNDNSIDYQTLNHLVDMSNKNYNDGIFIFSLNGEGPLLSIEEKKEIVSYLLEKYNGKIYLNIIDINIKNIINEIEIFIKMGISNFVIRIPSFYKISSDGLFKFYKKIFESFKNINFYITDYELKINCFKKIIKELPQIKGIIINNDYNIKQFGNLKSSLSFFVENKGNIFDYLSLGINNFIFYNAFYFGELLNEIFEDYELGFKNKLSLSYLKMVDEIFNELESPINVKYFIMVKGIVDNVNSRLPNYYDNKVNEHFDLLV